MRSRVGAALWLLATILVANWGSAAGFQVHTEPPGVSHGAASLTAEARFPQPTVVSRGLPRIAALDTHRQKAIRGHGGKSFGIVPEQVLLPPVTHQGVTPILRSDLLWSALVRAFEPRGPPNLTA